MMDWSDDHCAGLSVIGTLTGFEFQGVEHLSRDKRKASKRKFLAGSILIYMEDGQLFYSSLSSLDMQNVDLHGKDDASNMKAASLCPKPLKQGSSYQLHFEPSFSDEEYMLDKEPCPPKLPKEAPEVNLTNVLYGLFAILTRRNKDAPPVIGLQDTGLNMSFLESGKNGDSSLHSSVYMPSAPPFDPAVVFDMSGNSCGAYKEILETEPPEWLPDSSSNVCMQCKFSFTPLARGRHHCRFCGGLFCRNCTKGRCLLPFKFREREPQRVCDICYDRLDALQPMLIYSNSNAVQVAKHDVIDWTCMRGWLNMPVGLSMEHEIYKSSITLRSYCQIAGFNSEKSIPHSILKGAKGLAILTVVKVGAFLSYKFGTGLVVARRSNGSWSAPSAILSFGLGWGAQVGGELTDFIIVLYDSKAVKTFCSRMHFSFGAGLSAAAGPVGRVFEADLRAGDGGSGMCYTYSCSKGAFVGVSLEGDLVATRMGTNLRFYGDAYLTTYDILLGTVDRPVAAEPLYHALDDLFKNLRP